MKKKSTSFSIREVELANALEITSQKLDEIIQFFDSDPSDKWDLRENEHFIYLNKSLGERLFSEQGAYAIAKYIDEKSAKSIWSLIIEFVTKHKEKIRNSFISRKIQENSSSLAVRNNRHFLSKQDVTKILCTSPSRLNQAFEEIRKSQDPLKIYEDFDEFDVDMHKSPRYYSLSGLYKLSQHLAKFLTIKDRRSWCSAIEVVGKKTFKMIVDQQTAHKQKVLTAMDVAKKRDKKTCQITYKKHDKYNKGINIVAHHIYSKEHYPHLSACTDNLITLCQEIHDEFHGWNGGSQKPSNADQLIQFVNELYPENYDIILRLNYVKQILNVPQSNQKVA